MTEEEFKALSAAIDAAGFSVWFVHDVLTNEIVSANLVEKTKFIITDPNWTDGDLIVIHVDTKAAE